MTVETAMNDKLEVPDPRRAHNRRFATSRFNLPRLLLCFGMAASQAVSVSYRLRMPAADAPETGSAEFPLASSSLDDLRSAMELARQHLNQKLTAAKDAVGNGEKAIERAAEEAKRSAQVDSDEDADPEAP